MAVLCTTLLIFLDFRCIQAYVCTKLSTAHGDSADRKRVYSLLIVFVLHRAGEVNFLLNCNGFSIRLTEVQRTEFMKVSRPNVKLCTFSGPNQNR